MNLTEEIHMQKFYLERLNLYIVSYFPGTAHIYTLQLCNYTDRRTQTSLELYTEEANAYGFYVDWFKLE